MDPISISLAVVGIITTCVQVVQILKDTIETFKTAAEFLLQLLSQTERVRLFLEQLRSLTEQLKSRSDILLAFSPSAPKATLRELEDFVRDVAEKPKLLKLRLLLKRSTADELVKRLHRHEVEISQVLLAVATASAIRTEEQIRRMREDAVFHAQVTFPFSSETSTLVDAMGAQMDASDSLPPNIKSGDGPQRDDPEVSSASATPRQVQYGISDSIDLKEVGSPAASLHKLDIDPKEGQSPAIRGSSSSAPAPSDESRTHHSNPMPSEPATPSRSDTETLQGDPEPEERSSREARQVPIWFGDLSRQGFDASYLSLRDQLSDACYYGAFDRMFSVLAKAERIYRQSWANAPRLGRNPQQTSGWTPLHQATFMGAHRAHILRLVEDYGASRLLRSAWTNPRELSYRDMTAAEIARDLGFSDLYNVLAPVIDHCVPSTVLATLQTHFHELIRLHLRGSSNELAHLRLPELVVLTELKVPTMWFPLKSRGRDSIRGYMYRLDNRELLVKAFGISQVGRSDVVDEDHKETGLYRISESGVREIEEAITFNT